MCFDLSPKDAEVGQSIEALWAMMQERAQQGAAAKQAGNAIPDFAPVIVFVQEPSRLVELVMDMARIHLVSMITRLTPAYHMYFVVVEHQFNMTAMMQGKCLGLLFPVTCGVLLSADKSAHILFTDAVEFSGNTRAPRGYFVNREQASLGVVIDLPQEGDK